MIALLLASALAAAPGDPGWDPVLHDDPYTFCNTPGSRAEEARDWCDLLEDAPPDRCPGLRATCEGAPARADTEDLWTAAGCGQEGQRGRTFAKPDAPVEQTEPMQCGEAPPVASSAGAILRWVVAILVAVALVLVARLLWQWVGNFAPKPRKEVVEPVRVEVVASPDEVPDIPSDDLLSAARRALSDGRTGEAVLLARGAALRRLGEGGKVVLHRARTDREYVRSVRKDPEIEQPLRDVVRAVEQWRWGGRTVSAEVARRAIEAVERIVRALGAGLALWALSTGEASANRYGPYGDAALHGLFEEAGYDVSWRLRGLTTLEEDDLDVLVLDLAGVEPSAEDHEALRAWVAAGGVLIVGGDASRIFPEIGAYEDYGLDGADDTDTDGGDTDLAVEAWTFVTGADIRATSATPVDLPVPVWPGGPQMSFAPGAGQTWFEADFPGVPAQAVVVAMAHGQGAVIAIADGLLLRNAALVAPANEGFLVAAPYAAHDAGLADVPVPAVLQLATRAGSDSDTPWKSLANAHLLPFVLQLFVLGGLVVLWRGWPFAPLQDPPAEGRIAFADHVRALGTQWMRLRASRRALAAYGRLWLARVGAQGLEAAARRAGRDPESANRFVRDLEKVAAEPEGSDEPSDLEKMEELWKITQRL